MLYVSSACVKRRTIKESVEALAQQGFRNIELSGGTSHYPGYMEDLLGLKKARGLNYLVHNYFPPPLEDFTLNLASLKDEIHQKSLQHCRTALSVAAQLGARKFGVHAGFYIDFSSGEIGKSISASRINDKAAAMHRFCTALQPLMAEAKTKGVEIYVENNVLSAANAATFQGQNPFMFTDYAGYLEIKARIDVPMLLDVAHLYVSARTLGLDFEQEFRQMAGLTDYWHVSDNDGLQDQSRCFTADSTILKALKSYGLEDQTVTLETYGDMADIHASQALLAGKNG